MRTHRLFSLAVLICFSAGYAYGVDEVAKDFTFVDSGAGQKVEIAGKFADEGVRRVLLVSPGKADGEGLPLAAEVSGSEKNKLSFVLTNDVPPGRYFVKIQLGTETPITAGELRVPPLAEVQVTIATARPVSPYPNPKPVPNPSASPNPSPAALPRQYNFEIAGTNFSPVLEDNHIEIDDVAQNIPPCKTDGPIPCLGTERGNETRKLIVYSYSPTAFSRPLWISVRVGQGTNVAKAPTPLVFSSVSERGLRIYALGAFAILLAILFLLVHVGINLGKINKEKYGSLKAFLLDKETNSYSLSKLQLTLFTLVTVFGYIYVFICTLLVQWKFEMPPVPENLPGMMAISIGTSVVTAGIGAKIGGKGAGPTSPSVADFISSGGVVLAERFQFFVWTLVSVGGVLALILAADPVTLTQLPKLPDGMLYIMGLSSAGYLGGKLARGPGPSIKSLDAQLLPGSVVQFALHGDNLSSKATFQLDDEHIPADQVQIGQKTLQGQDLELCNMLEVKLSNVALRYFDGPHIFRIVNPDSQGADFKYGATIEAVSPIKADDPNYSDAATNYTVRGTNFKDPSAAEWIDAAGSVTRLAAENVTKKSETELLVSLPLGAEPAKLSILSPGGLKTTFDLTLGAHVETPTAAPPTVTTTEVAKVDVPETPAAGGKPVEPPYTALEVILTGENLSSEAGFALDTEPVPADQVIVVDKTPGTRDPKLCTMLTVHLKSVDPRFYDGPRLLRITNPYSSGVDVRFGMTIDKAEIVAAAQPPDSGFKVKLTGTNLEESSSGSFKSDAADSVAVDIPAADIIWNSAEELEVTLPVAATGAGTVTIKSPAELTATVKVNLA